MPIASFIISRLIFAGLTLLLVSLLIFGILEVLPGDVATRVLGRDATPETVAAVRLKLHLGDPALARYGHWLWGVLRGDLGVTLTNGRPVADVLAPRVLHTLALSGLAFLLYLPLAIIPAVIQATRPDSAIDHGISLVTLVLLSMPDFLLSTTLLFGFAVLFRFFPTMSTITPAMASLDLLRALFLPALTLALIMAVYAVRVLRDSLIEVLRSDYVRLAVLKGLSPRAVLFRHALPNALGPALNITALNLGFLVGGVVIVERVFSFPGFGTLLIDAPQLRDLPVIEATVLVGAAVYTAGNLLADLGGLLVNPRLRSAG